MRFLIFRYFTFLTFALTMTMLTIIDTSSIINFSTPVFATKATVIDHEFTAKLFGDMEVPPIRTNATGWAVFRPLLDENLVSYSLNVTDIVNVTAAHIHSGRQGYNGPIVVTLFESDLPIKRIVSGLMSEGNLTTDNLEGPFVDKQLSDLLSSMQSMELFVNVRTTQYPDGEIRGQISNSTSGMMIK